MQIVEIITGIYLFTAGCAIGSFLNVLIDRLPRGETVTRGRSHCDYCRRNLGWRELIPLLSYVLQKGKSRCCGKLLSRQYPLVELATGIGFCMVFFYGYPGYPPPVAWLIKIAAELVIFCCLTVIAVVDFKTRIIPDNMLVTGIIFTLLVLYVPGGASGGWNNIFAALGASMFFYALWKFTRGRGMGFGDVKLAVLMGLISGYPGIIISLYTAFLTGAVVGVILILGGKKKLKSRISFGPFLIFGLVVDLIWKNQILTWWKGIL